VGVEALEEIWLDVKDEGDILVWREKLKLEGIESYKTRLDEDLLRCNGYHVDAETTPCDPVPLKPLEFFFCRWDMTP
jgi:hypothetical protein